MDDLPADAAHSGIPFPGRRLFTQREAASGAGSEDFSYNSLVSLGIRGGGTRPPVPPSQTPKPSNQR
jgi:hypothetical protein